MKDTSMWRRFADQIIDQANMDRERSPLFLRWNYENGCMLSALLDVWKMTGENRYLKFVCDCAAALISQEGEIQGYYLEEYNLDSIREGQMLFDVFEVANDQRFYQAIKKLVLQIQSQPKTISGGFWHKKIYPNQMWLDGIYMYAPFLAQYAHVFQSRAWVDLVVDQMQLIYEHTKDPHTGLLVHGWDESCIQRWSDPVTGRSPHAWGRAMGWFMMAIVDVLEYLPLGHYGHHLLQRMLNELSDHLIKVQRKDTGLWLQVLDQPAAVNNYDESSCSSMFVYAIAKGVSMGVIPTSMLGHAKLAYQGLMRYGIRMEIPTGILHLKNCNSVAGLGGNPYRDGSLHYYLSESVVEDDTKGIFAFIKASLYMEKSDK